MKTISMMVAMVLALVVGGCDVVAPGDAGQPAAVTTAEAACAPRTKQFVRITAGMDYFQAVQACAEMDGSLARPVGAAEQQEFARVCREGLYDPRCWSAYATPEAVIAAYNADVLGVPVCEVWR